MNNTGIYKIIIANYFYFGSAINFNIRRKAHIYLLKNNIHFNRKMQNAYNKYKQFDFQIIEYTQKNNLYKIEQQYVTEHINNTNCLNLNRITGPGIIYERTPEIIAKQLATKILRGRFGGANKNSWKAATIANTGAKRSNEARKRMSNSKKELYKTNPDILSERQIKGRTNRWEKQCKPFILKDKYGIVHGPFKKQKDCYSIGIINHVSLNMLYNGKTNEAKGYKLVFLD